MIEYPECFVYCQGLAIFSQNPPLLAVGGFFPVQGLDFSASLLDTIIYG
jgi:hypothetical protein